MRLSEQSRQQVRECKELLHCVLLREKDNHTRPDNDEDDLRYTLFLLELGEALEHVCGINITADMSDEDVREMCDRNGLTVKGALNNAKMNMVMEAFKTFSKIL